MSYKNVEDEIVLKGWDKDKKAYIGTSSNGKTFYTKKSPKLKDVKMKYGIKARAKLGKKEGTDIWYINSIELPESSVPAASGFDAQQSAPQAADKPAYDSKGQEKGNFRTNLTNVILSGFAKGISDKEIQEIIVRYIALLEFGEVLRENPAEDSPVDLPAEEVEADEPAEEDDAF